MTTRSSTLAATLAVQDAFTILYTTPAGSVTIVKSVYWTLRSGTAATIILDIHRQAGTTVDLHRKAYSPDAANWTGWVVLEAGDELRAYILSGTADMWASGAELMLPPSIRSQEQAT